MSVYGVAAIQSERVTNHETCAWAAKPKNSGGDLLGPAKPPNRLVFHQLFHGFRLTDQHARDHRRIDDPRAHRIDADAPRGVFQSGALSESEHPVLASVIRCPASQAHESAERRTIDDRAA